MKPNTLIRLFVATAMLAATYSCKDDNDSPSGESAVLAIQDADAELNCIWVFDIKPQTVGIRAQATTHSTENLTVTFKVDRSQVEAYNQAHGTSYEPAPAGTFSFSKEQAILPRYNELSSTAELEINVASLPDDGKLYLLPVTIDQIKGDDRAQVAETNGVSYILFKKVPSPVLLERTDWKLLHFTSQWPEGTPKTGYAKDLLDGNPATYWGYDFKTTPVRYAPFYFVFDLGKEVTVRGVQYLARTDPKTGALKNPPGDIVIETSNSITGDGMSNDSEWTYSERFKGDVLPHQLLNSAYLSTMQRARYVRFTINMSWNSGSATKPTPMTYKGGCFAEFNVWGNLEKFE